MTCTCHNKRPAQPFTALDFGPDIDRSREERHKRWDEIGQLNKELEALRKEYRKRKAEINKKIEALDY